MFKPKSEQTKQDKLDKVNTFFSEDYRPIEKQLEQLGISGSGGGGCFPTGTLVRTPRGFRQIDKIVSGEPVIAYDRFGQLSEGRVTIVHRHKPGEHSESIYFVYSGETSLFPKGITGNHAVFDNVTGEHKLISQFQIYEEITLLDGTTKTISRINRTSSEEVTVYNLTIEPQHTYLVGTPDLCVRVHNGGGGKDAGGGEARQAVEASNTLQSEAIAKVLEVYSYGECEGIVGGAKGATFNNTPVQNADDTFNFPKITFEERVGTPTQTTIVGFEETEAEQAVAGTILTQAGSVEQLVDSNVDAARITIRLTEGLWYQNKSNGDLLGHTITWTVETMDVAIGTWNHVLTKTLNDKTTSPWEIAHRIEKPAGAVQWSIRVKRWSPIDSGANYKSVIAWVRLTEIFQIPVDYSNIAHVGVTMPASATGNRIPSRAYQVKGIKIQIPINYDPLLRTYGTGYWNGQFKVAWSDNPAWVLYDLLTHPVYGVEDFLNHSISIDIMAFYEAALYCDAASWNGTSYDYNLLDDGQAGLEVRYTFNTVISTQQDAWQLLHAVASNMRAILVNAGDQISLLQDRPRGHYKIFNNTNIIDGLFIYSGTEVTSRATQINCTFSDKNDRYLPRTIAEDDAAAIAKWGHSVKPIIAYGCTSESQARRMAKWALYTEINQADLVAFSVALNIIDVSVGDIIAIMDTEYISDANQYLSGRVESVSGNIVTLGNEVDLLFGYTYTLGVMSLDYEKIEEVIIVNGAGKTDTLTTTTLLPAGDYINHEFYCFSSGNAEQEARKFIIQSITEAERGIYAISGLAYEGNKFAAVEQGIVVPPKIYSNLTVTVIPQVTNITFHEYFTNTGIASENHIDVRWDWQSLETFPDGTTVDRSRETLFLLRWRRDNGAYITVDNIAVKNFEIPSTIPGVYEVLVSARNVQGKSSLSTFATYNYRVVGATSTLVPPENFYVGTTFGIEFIGTHIPLTWTFPLENEDKTDTLLDYLLEVWKLDGSALISSHIITPDTSRNGSFDYTLQQNINDYINASRNVQLKIYSRDGAGDVSLPRTVTFTNPTPAAPNFLISSGTEAAYINITPSTDLDIAGYEIHRSTTTFTASPATRISQGPDTYLPLKGVAGQDYFYQVGAYDTFGRVGMLYSNEQQSTMLSSVVPVWVFSGLTFKPNDPTSNRVSWTAGSASVDGGTPVAIAASNTSADWTTGVEFIYFNKTTEIIESSTDLALAVQSGPILASYRGGNAITVGNGNAFIDGANVIAGTVGANQLVADSAIITSTLQVANAIINTANIANAAITNALIDNIIKSTNFSDIAFTGWQINKAGDITSYGSLVLKDQLGNVIFSADELDGTYIKHATIDTAQIKDLAATTAKIKDLAVSTLKIKDQAVTFPVASFIEAGIILPEGSSIQTNALLNYPSTGAPLQIDIGCLIQGLATSAWAYIDRNQGAGWEQIGVMSVGTENILFKFLLNEPAGNYSFRLLVGGAVGWASSSYHNFIGVTEFKK